MKEERKELTTLILACGGHCMTCICGSIFYCDGNCPKERGNNIARNDIPTKDFCMCPLCLEKHISTLGTEYIVKRRKCFLKVDS